MIETARPHYLLFAAASNDRQSGRWRFVLRTADGAHRLEATDVEPESCGERLELMTVARGLEALEQPSRVTLIVARTYIREGLLRGVAQWRSNGWRWECFGQMVPVKNLDLWQRIDLAMKFHQIDCRTYRVDPPHPRQTAPLGGSISSPAVQAAAVHPTGAIQYRLEAAARTLGPWPWPWPRPWLSTRLATRLATRLRPWHWPRLATWLATWLRPGRRRAQTRTVAPSREIVECGSPEPFPPGPHLTV